MLFLVPSMLNHMKLYHSRGLQSWRTTNMSHLWQAFMLLKKNYDFKLQNLRQSDILNIHTHCLNEIYSRVFKLHAACHVNGWTQVAVLNYLTHSDIIVCVEISLPAFLYIIACIFVYHCLHYAACLCRVICPEKSLFISQRKQFK